MKKFSILQLRVTSEAVFIAIFIWSLPFISFHPLRSPGITQQSVYRAIDFELRSPGFQLQHLLDGTVVIQADGFPLQDAPGELALPHQVVHLALPPDADAGSLQLEIVSAKIEQLPGSYNIQRMPLDSTSETLGGRIVKPHANTGVLAGYVRLLSSGQMRKWRFIQLDYTPFSVDAVSGKASMASQVNLRVHYQTAPDGIDPALLNDTVMDEIAQELFLNYAQAQAWYSPPQSPDAPNVVYDYVIITTNNIETNSTKLDDFIAHKQSLGFSVLTITQDEYGSLVGQSPNGTAEKIRKWLQDNYASYSIKYVLLIGNPDPDDPSSGSDSVGDVPMKMCWPRWDQSADKESPTDYFFADLTGNWDLDGDNYYGEYNPDFGTGGVDFANEVFVGRIPVYSAAYSTLDAILQKIIDYENESNPFSWRKSALLPMSFSLAGYDGAPLAEQMMDDYLDGASFTSWTQYQQGSGACSVDSSYSSNQELRGGTVVRDRWAANDYGLVVWWGHGSATSASVGYEECWDGTLFSNSQTSTLDDDHPSFVYQNSCTNGYPENTSNLQYALLKQGALATVSASRVSWFNSGVGYGDFDGSTTNSGIGYEYARRLIQGQPAAQALYNAKTSMIPTSNTRVMNYFDFNLYGDPAAFLLPLRTPTSLSATPVSQTQINLSWTDNSITEGGYKIERSPNGSTSWSQIATVGTNVTSYASTGLTCGTPYFYRARAYNTWGNSPYSSTANATTAACLPGAFSKNNPANSATGLSTSPTLSWGASSSATSYDYCIDTSNDSTCTLPATWINVGNTTNKALSGLSSSTTFYWQVRANNASGTTYANSDTWWMFTTASSSPPGAFNKTSPAIDATGIALNPTLTWEASSGATSYEYCIDTNNDNACNLPAIWVNVGNVTSYDHSGLNYNTLYFWQVRAKNDSYTTEANNSNWWSFTTLGETTFLYLPMLTQGDHTTPDVLANGDFESGRNVGWSEYSNHSLMIVVTAPTLQIAPHSGSWSAWLGRKLNDETSRLWQQVTVSASQPYLHYWIWIDSQDFCNYDYGWVQVNTVNVATYNLCATQNTGGWVEKVVNLSAYAGQSITLEFRVETDGSYGSSLFVDDISFSSLAMSNEGISDPSTSEQFPIDRDAAEAKSESLPSPHD